MSGDQIIFLIILAIVIGAGFYVAGDVCEIFAEEASDDDPYGDWPHLPPGDR